MNRPTPFLQTTTQSSSGLCQQSSQLHMPYQKRRAEEPASPSRCCKQPRLSDQKDGFSPPAANLINIIGIQLAGWLCAIPASVPKASEDKFSHEETTSVPSLNMPRRKRDSLDSTASSSSLEEEDEVTREVSEPAGVSLSLPEPHLEPSSYTSSSSDIIEETKVAEGLLKDEPEDSSSSPMARQESLPVIVEENELQSRPVAASHSSLHEPSPYASIREKEFQSSLHSRPLAASQIIEEKEEKEVEVIVTEQATPSPQSSPKAQHEPSSYSSIEEEESEPYLLPQPASASQSSLNAHHQPSSSITTIKSNTQPSSCIECGPVKHHWTDKVDHIRLDSSYSSFRSSQITGSSFSRDSTVQSKETSTIPRKTRIRPLRKPHIRERQFKAEVRKRKKEDLKLVLYRIRSRHRELIMGGSVNAGPMTFADYQTLLQNLLVDMQPRTRRINSSTRNTLGASRFVRGTPPPIFGLDHDADDSMKRTLENAKATLNSPKPPLFFASDEQRKLNSKKDVAIVPGSLPPEEDEEVTALLRKRGVVAKFAREQVSDGDIQRLTPGQWLNDEIINFYGAMILARSEANKENVQAGGKPGGNGSLDVHYFSSFFWAKLTKEGYAQGRLAKWTKKINIFSKDVILIPINHSNAHWTAAAINFRQKRIESYDSMGMAKRVVFTHLRLYLDAEHRDKKKKPFDFTGWENYAPEDTPQQENGFDCGVFACHFLEALSRGVTKFSFAQRDMPYLRRRMIWEIGNAQLRNDYK